MPRVLAFADYYLPGHQSGGLRSLANLVARLGDRFEFHVVTRNRDSSGPPYPDVRTGSWTTVGAAHVLYLGPRELWKPLRSIVADVRPDVVYLNSLFSRLSLRILLLRRLGLLLPAPAGVVLAPRGELSEGALSVKPRRKALVLRAARAGGLFEGVSWSATNEAEADRIRRVVDGRARIAVAPDLPEPALAGAFAARPEKRPGALRLVFLGRVSPVKNLPFALAALDGLEGSIDLDVWGRADEARYLDVCRERADRLPKNVRVAWRGAAPRTAVREALASAHVFVLPTLGENFGHAILEALAAGLPVLVSDATPWRGLAARRAGWDLPLDLPAFREALSQALAWDDDEYRAWSAGARAVAEEALASPEAERATADLLTSAATGRSA